MFTLNELAKNLQEFIIDSQMDAHNAKSISKYRYNNLKISISSKFSYPNFVVQIGISEAIYDLQDITKVDGGLGQDEKYVLKWLNKKGIIDNLNELYQNLTELQQMKMSAINIKMQGDSGTAEKENYQRRNYNLPKNDIIIIDEDIMSLLETGLDAESNEKI